MIRPLTQLMLIFIFLLMNSCAARSKPKPDFNSWNRHKLLAMTGIEFLFPTESYVLSSQVSSIKNALAAHAAQCEMSILNRTASDQDLRVIWLLWGYGNGRNKNEVIRRFGNEAYSTAIGKYVAAQSTCSDEINQITQRFLNTLKKE